ncbi:MAG TPA: RNA polymerase factor sigma-54 [Chthonomonadales bacterium]|nr:RNA polymerase factor sigma-54 [Chthonomonadales bacterium]
MLLRQDQRQVQAQKIDPKLIMANAMLQQGALELTQQIEAELMDNPALDVMDVEAGCNGECPDPATCPYCSQRRAADAEDEADEAMDVPPDVFEFHQPSGADGDPEFDTMGNLEAEHTLQDHLRSHMRAAIDEVDYPIAQYLIDCLDERGWLNATVEEVAAELGRDVADVERVLAILQGLDPPGVGARDVRECMMIQLSYLAEEGVGEPVAERMVRGHFELMVSGKHARIARVLGVPVERVREAVDFVRCHLNPYPAAQFRASWAHRPSANRSAVRPDVVVRRTPIGYEVDVVGAEPFVLGINPSYREMYERIRRGGVRLHAEEAKHITEYVERAELFIRNLKQRRRTLRLITRCIVGRQQGFLATGSRSFIQPLTRTAIATSLSLHESTVSRATAGKYVQLPNQEVVPFEVFFDSSLSVKMAIEALIAEEDPAHPLSDQQIAELLREQGIDVARRTVVKYRDAQKILSSNRRRRLSA